VSGDGDAVSGALRALHSDLQRDTRERFDRDLPLDEMVFDRWQRARSLGFGEGTSIYHNTYVLGEVRVAAHVWIGPMVMLDGSGGGIEIGESCCVSAGAHLYTHDTIARSLTGGRAGRHSGPVRVGARSYIGSGAVIVPGVTVGDHSVIGAGSVVTRDVPPFSAAIGVPARVRGRVVVDESAGTAAIDWDA
jgi:acetyltransferase-like isoleucine patch superfamily enzyme